MNDTDNQNRDKVFVLKKKYIIAVAAAILILLVVMLAFLNRQPDEISLFYSSAEQGAVVVNGDKIADEILKGKSVSSVSYSFDKSSAAVLMSDGESYVLYYTDGRKCIKIADSCTNKYIISLDGSKVMYVDSIDELYVFDSEKGKSKSVAAHVNEFCISPSGDIAVYSKTADSVQTLYVCSGSTSSAIAENYIPLAVSDDLEYIYVLSSDNSLYVLDKSGNVKSKICSEVSLDMFCFSYDMNDVVFSDGTYTYISQCGKSRVRLVSQKAVPTDGNSVQIFCDSGLLSSVYESLTDIFYTVEDINGTYVLYFINKDCSRIDIAGNVDKYSFTDNGSLVYLNSEGKIYKYSSDKSSLIFSGAYDMLTDSKGKYIYYVDASQSLYVIKNGASVLLASGVEKMYITNDDVLLFVMTDGRLYFAAKDNQAQLIDESVYGCVCNSSSAFYVKNYSTQTGNFELYASDGDDNFELINEKISSIV